MISRRLLLPSALVLAALVAPAAASAQDPPPPPAPPPLDPTRIVPGAKAVGVDVGGLTVPEATARLQELVGLRLSRNIVVSVAGDTYRLGMRTARFRFDAERTAKRAFYTARKAPPGTPVDVPAAVRYSRRAILAFLARVSRGARVAPRDASVRITLRRMIVRGSRSGRVLQRAGLRPAIEAALANPALSRVFKPGRIERRPRVTADELPARYPTVVTIDRSNFRLRLFKRLQLAKTYPIAVGAAGYDTPAGLYRIQNKAVNPAWNAPNQPWAGLYAGRTVAGGAPDNPLKARWLGIANGVGIHGTGDLGSIGTRASHGCIRMTVPAVIDLYRQVPLGTPVLVG
jgi:lipoprotein-anchoring transpeptidase ErfK/SrfK